METFPDEGDVDFVKVIQVYKEVGYQYLLMPDHVPVAANDPNGLQSFAFCYGYIRALIERAAAAKCSALVLTVDLQVIGQRHRDIKNGMSVPPEIRIKNLVDIATKPRWAMSVLKGKRKTFGNIVGHYPGMSNITVLSKWTAEQFDPTLSWKDVEWIKSLWPGKLILKGILDVEDARIAAKTGAAAIRRAQA